MLSRIARFLQPLYVVVVAGVPRSESLEQPVSRTFAGHFGSVDQCTMQVRRLVQEVRCRGVRSRSLESSREEIGPVRRESLPSQSRSRAPHQEVLSTRLAHRAQRACAVCAARPKDRSDVTPVLPPSSGDGHQVLRQKVIGKECPAVTLLPVTKAVAAPSQS